MIFWGEKVLVKKIGEKIGVYDWKLKKKWKSCEKTRTNKKKSFQPPYNSRVKLTNFLSGRVFIIFHVQSENCKICEKVVIFFSKILLFHEIVYTLISLDPSWNIDALNQSLILLVTPTSVPTIIKSCAWSHHGSGTVILIPSFNHWVYTNSAPTVTVWRSVTEGRY